LGLKRLFGLACLAGRGVFSQPFNFLLVNLAGIGYHFTWDKNPECFGRGGETCQNLAA